MTKLTDMQLVLLTSACQREDGSLLPPPESLGDQADRIRKAVEALIKKGLVAEREGMAAVQACRTDGDLTFGVIVTDAGRALIDPPASSEPNTGGGMKGASKGAGAEATTPRITKQTMVLDLLNQESGATLDDIVEATGWLPHTSRAALTGLRKKGHEISSEKVDGSTRYQIKAAASS